MRSIALSLFLLLFTVGTTVAQTDSSACPCCTDAHAAFDFWVGAWDVFNKAGAQVGENRIEKVENKCVLTELWTGAQGGTGRSFNYYSAADSTWNQLWLDNKGSKLELKGRAEPGKMILQSELMPGQRVDFYRNRITWTANDDGTVTQLWEILDKDGKVLQTAFEGIYKRK